MWEINNFNQYTCFLYAIILGALMEIVYDLFKFDRTLFKRSKVVIFISDVLLWVIYAFTLFSFCVVFSNGQIRGYIVFANLLGFIIFRFTVSKLFWHLFKPIKKIANKIKRHYLFLLEKANFLLSRIVVWVKKLWKNIFFNKKEKNNKIIEKNNKIIEKNS